jgi:hypothetical protein
MKIGIAIYLTLSIIFLQSLLSVDHQLKLESPELHSCTEQNKEKEQSDTSVIIDFAASAPKREPSGLTVEIEDTFSEINQPKFSIDPRGPRVHGFQLGMTYKSLLDLFKTLNLSETQIGLGNYGEGEINIGDYVGISNLIVRCAGFAASDTHLANIPPGLAGCGLFDLSDKYIGSAALTLIVAGDKKSVIYFSLERVVLEQLFKIATLSYDEFVQKFISAYHIPKLNVVKAPARDDHLASYYIDKTGWKIIFNGYENKIKSVQFLVAAKESEQGFGK